MKKILVMVTVAMMTAMNVNAQNRSRGDRHLSHTQVPVPVTIGSEREPADEMTRVIP